MLDEIEKEQNNNKKNREADELKLALEKASDSEKLIMLFGKISLANQNLESIERHLHTIKTILIIFTTLIIIGLIIQGCQTVIR